MAFLKDIIEKPLTGEWGTDGDEVNVLRTTNFTNLGVIDFSNVVKRSISEKKVQQKKLLKGDIIIEKSGGSPKQPVGRVVFFNEEGTYLCNNFTSILRPKKEKVEPKYLHYLLYASHRFGVTGMFQNKTTGIINLQLPRYVNKLEIPLPPLKTQQHIAQILDDASALRDKTKKLLKEYDLLAQSLFLEMFGDPGTNKKGFEIRQLDEFYSSKKEGTKCGPFGGALKKEEYVEKGIAVWNMDNISKTGELNTDIKLWITEDKFAKLETYNVINNDIIISRAGTVGKMCVVKSSYEKSIISTNLIRLRLNSSLLLPLFFSAMMNYFKERVGRLKTGAEGSFTHMNTGVLNNLKFPYPPINLQNQFAEKIALIEQQKTLAKEELQESENLFNCLLQKAFNAELM